MTTDELHVLRREAAYWQDRAEKLEKAMGHLKEYADRSSPTNFPPEPPVGTRFLSAPGGAVVWERREVGWHCPREDCDKCPEEWGYCWEFTDVPVFHRVLPSTSDSPADGCTPPSAGDTTSPPRGPTEKLQRSVGSQPRGGELEASIARGLAEYAAAYFIPANRLFIGREREVAKTWGRFAAPYIADCVREDRRRGGEADWQRIAVKLAGAGADFIRLSTAEADALRGALEDANAIEAETRCERTADAATYHQEAGDG